MRRFHLGEHGRAVTVRWLIRGAVGLAAAFAIVGGTAVPLLNARVDAVVGANVDLRGQLRSQADRSADALDSAQAQYSALFTACQESPECLAKAPAPTLITPTPGPAGATGATGPAGRAPTDAEVQAAVSAYCIAHDACRGIPGVNGSAGTNGSNGTNGTDGRAGSDSTVPGPQGPTGATGADGRGITSAVCDDAGRWQLTYTDGTTADAGSCRTSLLG